MVVLDEADEMLDMGFAEDIDAILDARPRGPSDRAVLGHHAAAASTAIADRHLTDPVRIHIGREATAEGEAPQVRQTAYVVHASHKPAALGRILDVESPTAAIVFCRTRAEVDQLTETLNGRGYRAEALHGGMNQEPARPGHGPAAAPAPPTCSSPPTSPPAASTSTSSPTS